MADAPHNGSNGSIPGRIERIGQSLISTLPPAFLLLIAINVGFLWFLADQMETRAILANKIIDHCLDLATHAPH